jgi:hypothetical protein
MPKLKMHGGYTLDRSVVGMGMATYWTCGHTAICGPEPAEPSMDCPKCAAMDETELRELIKTRKIVFADPEEC